MKSPNELREMSDIELSEQLSQLRMTLFNLKSGNAQSTAIDIKNTKKTIVQILAIQNERRLQKY